MEAAVQFTHIDASKRRPTIEGTDIKVSLIAQEVERVGMTVDEILQAHPHLTLSQVYAALAYYHDHRAAIRQEWVEAEALVAELQGVYT